MGNQEFLLEYFEKFGYSREAKIFLKFFKKIPPQEFAMVKIGGNCLESSMPEIASALAILSKMSLCPVVVHGAGQQLSKQLLAIGTETKKVSGLRVTGGKELQVIESIFYELNTNFVERINSAGGKAKTIPGEKVFGVVPHEKINGEDIGFVGKIVGVNPEPVIAAIGNGFIPIVSPIGKIGKQNYNINADCAAKELFLKLKQKKIIFLTDEGGIKDANGRIIQSLSFNAAKKLIADKVVKEGMKFKLEEILSVLSLSDHSFSAQICSPKNFLAELFSLQGSGTFIKKDSEIITKKQYLQTDKKKIKAVLESAFKKKLKDNFFEEKPFLVLSEKKCKAIAIVKKMAGLNFLDKIAVGPEFQGEDLANSLWIELEKKVGSFFWRATPGNPINSFYFKKCSGAQKFPEWNVFWKNMDAAQSAKAIKLALEKPGSFEANGDLNE